MEYYRRADAPTSEIYKELEHSFLKAQNKYVQITERYNGAINVFYAERTEEQPEVSVEKISKVIRYELMFVPYEACDRTAKAIHKLIYGE